MGNEKGHLPYQAAEAAQTEARSHDGAETSSLKKNARKWQLLRQVQTSLGPIMATISIGATFGYSAVLLPQLKTLPINGSNVFTVEDVLPRILSYPITINTIEEESWIAASAVLLMAPGCWLSGMLMERFGRRKTQIVISPLYIFAWFMVGIAPDFRVLIAGRLLSGLCVGLQSPLGPVYVAETSEPRLRGLLLASISLAIAVGILISHILGTWLSWRVAAYLLGIFPALCLLCCLFARESPSWLMKKNRMTKATVTWRYLRGNDDTAEFRALGSIALKNRSTVSTTDNSTPPPWRSPSFLKPFAILNVFFLTAQFSGVNAVAFYCIQIVADVSGSLDSSGTRSFHYATLILDVFRVAASALTCWLTRRYPRRVLALVSGTVSTVSLLVLSAGLILDLGRPWVPGSMLFVYTCAVCVGLVPLPWLLCGEIFPVAVRGLGSGLSSGFAFVYFFIVVKTGPLMLENLGTACTFFFYGSVTATGTVFLYFCLPETKDKTLREIEEQFAKNVRDKEQPQGDAQT